MRNTSFNDINIIDSQNQTDITMCYSREDLLQLRVSTDTRLPTPVWNNITSFGIRAKPVTRRGRRGGKRHPRYHSASNHQTNNEMNQIPVLVSSHRPTINHSTLDHGSVKQNLLRPHINREPLMNLCLWNPRSIRNKTTTCSDYVIEHDVDVMFLVETWLAPQDPVVIGELKPNGYDFISVPRGAINYGGGLGILSKTQLGFRIHNTGIQTVNFEHTCVFDPKNGVYYVVIYRTYPSAENGLKTPDFLKEFDDFLNEITLLPGKLVLIGDFNFHMNKPSKTEVAQFSDILCSYDLEQHIDFPTHISGNILDLIITRSDEGLIRLCSPDHRFGSDHHIVRCLLQQQKPLPLEVTCTFRNYRDLDMDSFQLDLASELYDSEILSVESDVNREVDNFNSAVSQVLDRHAPSDTRTCKIRPRFPWYSPEISEARRERRKLERRWRKSQLQCDKDSYWKQHLYVNKLIEQSKSNYYRDALKDANPKQTFRILGNVMHQNIKALPSFDSPDNLSNKFAEYFIDKVVKIRTSIDSNVSTNVVSDQSSVSATAIGDGLVTPLNGFRVLKESEIHEIITDAANKTCNLDSLPTWLLKHNISVVVPYITHIVNDSLQNGVFPEDLKRAIVTPILKKPTLDWNGLQNYRPVSNISFIGKVIEKAAICQVNEHLEANNLEEVAQSAYKCKHSTETALLVVNDHISRALDDNHAVFLVMLDLSAAFDTIDHDILFQRLDHDFGIKGTALNWFISYMSNRNFTVSVGGHMSKVYHLDYGVPQGSIIGPRAFTMYSQPVANIIRKYDIQFHIYADDTQLYACFDPKIPGDSACAMFKLIKCVEEIHQWMNDNKLKLNESKTEFFIAASQHNQKILQNTTLQIGSEIIHPSDSVKNLGVHFNSNMDMSTQVTSICRSVNFILWNISRIRRFIDSDSCNHAMRALVLSRLDYANSLLAGCSAANISRLQKLQNKAARIIYQVSRRHSITPLLESLHWLPVSKRIMFKILLHVYKTLNGHSPTYLTDSIKVYQPSRQGLRSAKDTSKLVIPHFHRRAGDRAFSVAAPKMWNTLPPTLRSCTTVNGFKSQLKTYLFTI